MSLEDLGVIGQVFGNMRYRFQSDVYSFVYFRRFRAPIDIRSVALESRLEDDRVHIKNS